MQKELEDPLIYNNRNIITNNYYSQKLLENCGFPANFFELIENFPTKDVLSKTELKAINNPNKSHRLDENEISSSILIEEFGEHEIKKKFNEKEKLLEINSKNKLINQLKKKKDIIQNDEEALTKDDSNLAVKSYKSKYKNKFKDIYENNSILLQNKNKYKLYHKCCYPGCNRTFTYSGWLKAHYKKHLNEIQKGAYCRLFEKYKLENEYNLLRNINKLSHNKCNNMNTLYNNFSLINPHCNIFNNLYFSDNNIINNRANFENKFIFKDNSNYSYNNINGRYFNSILSSQNDKFI
jgi:hypothetical protein